MRIVGKDQLFIINTDELISPSDLREISAGVNLFKDSVISVDVTGRASIDGPETFNDSLASARAAKIKEALVDVYKVPSDRILTASIGEDWTLFTELVARDENVPYKAQLLEIITDKVLAPDTKEAKIRRLGGGEPWRYLVDTILPSMRSAEVVWQVARPVPVERRVFICDPEEPLVEEVVEVVEIAVVEEPAEDWYRKMYIKTNAPAWAMLWQNLAVEFDLARHWSFALPVYWSPYNYGKQTLKFRTLACLPEFRYWPKADNTGFFINAHFGIASYNYAKNGEYRYQDHKGHTPAIGGGIGIGYRFYFCRNHHWSMEVAVGAGAYKLDYDIFLNTPSTKDGYLVGRRKRTFFGVDQAAFTFSYSFGLRKKGGNK